jgi:hypothetical protein
MNIDGSRLHRLTAVGCCLHDGSARYSPDGRTIAFVSDRWYAPREIPENEIWEMNVDGINRHLATSSITRGGCPDELVGNCNGPISPGIGDQKGTSRIRSSGPEGCPAVPLPVGDAGKHRAGWERGGRRPLRSDADFPCGAASKRFPAGASVRLAALVDLSVDGAGPRRREPRAEPITPPELVPDASACPRVCGQARGPARGPDRTSDLHFC